MDSNALRIAVIVVIVFSVFVTTTFPASPSVTADSFGVNDANGYKNTMVSVPVTITNVQNGPVTSIVFDIAYDKSVINITDVQKGELTAEWDNPDINNDFPWGTTISMVYDTTHALQNGSTGSIAVLNFSVIGEPGEISMTNLMNIDLAGPPPDYQPGTAPAKNGTLSILSATPVFNTGLGTYPSISGTFNGTIKPNQIITVYKLYTYPCPGTGGHSEYVRIYNESDETIAEGMWAGYKGDWQNIAFDKTFTLFANETYNYTLRTSSYPQIIHESSKEVIGGTITCTNFTDANGVVHYDWIPAIKLF
jgi:hypothetical protein